MWLLLPLLSAALVLCPGCAADRAPPSAVAEPRPASAAPAQGQAAPRLDRKIIRTAELDLTVKDLDAAQQELRRLIGALPEAYIASATVTGAAGAPRAGQWRVRIPAAQLDSFLAAVARLGTPRRQSVEAKDVTEEYYDLDAHVRNKRLEEERLQRHLQQSTGKLDEILAVERELSRVRGEIEQNEGKLRLLANLTSLTTVAISLEETHDYLPAEEPGLGGALRGTLVRSVVMLGAAARGLLLVLAGALPWLLTLTAVGAAVLSVRRRLRRQRYPRP